MYEDLELPHEVRANDVGLRTPSRLPLVLWITLQNMGGDTTRLEREVSVSSLLLRQHADLDTAYFAPNDEVSNQNTRRELLVLTRWLCCCKDELGRLDYNHELVLKFLQYNLFLAPIDVKKMQRVLDIGTGTGICESPINACQSV